MLSFLLFLIQFFLLFFRINNQGNSDSNILKGIFRIDSLYNQYSLTHKEKEGLKFIGKKNIPGQKFEIIKNNNNKYYYIKLKGKLDILETSEDGDIILGNPSGGQIKKSMEWELIKIKDTRYLIKNHKNKNFLEINNNTLQCKNKLEIKKSYIIFTQKFVFSLLKFYEEVDISKEDLKIIEKEPIDVLIKYIDLSDKALNRTGIKQIKKDEDNEELRYSVRSILKHLPWIRKIYILMPNEKVKYFKPYKEIKEKIVYVKDKDILGFDSANIYAFTFNLFKLKKFGLTENFIYMDDDFFIGQDLKKSDFFYYDKKEKRVVPSLSNTIYNVLNKNTTMKYYKYLYSIKDKLNYQGFNQYILSLICTEKFFLDYYENITIISPEMTHNAIAYNIKDLEEIYKVVVNNYKYANEMLNSKERFVLTLQTQHFVDLYQLNIKHKKVHPISTNVIVIDSLKKNYLYTPLFAINTGVNPKYTEAIYKNLRKVMKERFPNKTPYEIDEENNNSQIGNANKKIDKSSHNIFDKNITKNNNNISNASNNNNINNKEIKNKENNKDIKNNTNNESNMPLVINKNVNNNSKSSNKINNLNINTINNKKKKEKNLIKNVFLEITIRINILFIFLILIFLKVINVYYAFIKKKKNISDNNIKNKFISFINYL